MGVGRDSAPPVSSCSCSAGGLAEPWREREAWQMLTLAELIHCFNHPTVLARHGGGMGSIFLLLTISATLHSSW